MVVVKQRGSPGCHAAPAGSAVIDHVADGDTVVLCGGSTVRLVQIDTPEVFFAEECFGAEASDETKHLLPPGTVVGLVADPALDDVDGFGRLLRYVVRADGLDVNRRLVADGAATPYFYGGARGMYADELLRDAEAARAAGKGLWGACSGTDLNVHEGVLDGAGGARLNPDRTAPGTAVCKIRGVRLLVAIALLLSLPGLASAVPSPPAEEPPARPEPARSEPPQRPAPVRPPQFVVASFDGAGGARMWTYWRSVARRARRALHVLRQRRLSHRLGAPLALPAAAARARHVGDRIRALTTWRPHRRRNAARHRAPAIATATRSARISSATSARRRR